MLIDVLAKIINTLITINMNMGILKTFVKFLKIGNNGHGIRSSLVKDIPMYI